ncbi:MAG: Hsp33 family molecular chaperone HslO [Mycoplasma sp.]|nr:Hsp33 family molecular chaperone HslO [Mycoplasma sp.]
MSKIKLFIKNNVRIYISDLTNIANKALKIHNSKPLGSLVLGTAIAVLGPLSIIKRNEKVTAIINGKGANGTIIVDSNSKGDIRASISDPTVTTDVDKTNPNMIPLSIGVGTQGSLKLIQTLSGITFGGEVKLVKGDIVTDMAYYYETSEQIKTAIISSVLLNENGKSFKRSYSYLFQMLPGHTEEDLIWTENFIKKHKPDKLTIEEYEEFINGQFLEEKSIQWKCNCDEKGFKKILSNLSEKEKEKLIKEYGAIIIECHFCKNVKKFK